jgi:hypothetical protein
VGREPAMSWPGPWACSLFAALGDADQMLYGRNFDWRYAPALLLFTDPPDGYASVSMVDISYLGFEGTRADGVADLPLVERRGLLAAPAWPFDGMNERGLVVGMAAVPAGPIGFDPDKETIGSLEVIRLMLDSAGNVDQAVAILHRYNVDMAGIPIHYLIADPSGRAVLVEFYGGETITTPNGTPWHQATNFIRAAVEDAQGQCHRYDAIYERLEGTGGRIGTLDALALLEEVSQGGEWPTQWSVVYGMSSGQVHLVMGRQYGNVHIFHLVEALRVFRNP